MKKYEIKRIMSGPAKFRFALIVNGWEMYETFRSTKEAQEEIKRRQATEDYGHDYGEPNQKEQS